jgi:multidrug efflux system membrane fusion protein
MPIEHLEAPPQKELTSPADRRQPATPPRKRWVWPVIVCALCLLAFPAYRFFSGSSGDANKSKKVAGPEANRGVPVIVATARSGDLPIYLDGLGTVTAFKTVMVRARVDGQLIKVGFDEGQLVSEGDLLAEIDPRPFQADLDSKVALESEAEAQRDLAKITYDHLIELMPENSASPIEYKQAKATLKQAEAALAGAGANVASARLNVEWCRITAPISGKVGLRLVDQGNQVRAEESGGIAVITQLKPIAVVFSLPQDTVPLVLKAQAVKSDLVAEAYNSDLRTLLTTGKLEALDSQIDSSTGTARLKAVFENEPSVLYPNQFVNIRLLIDTRKSVTLIPSAAVQRSPQAVFVYVVKADQTVDMRPIKPGPTERGVTLVEQGLSPGEIVVTEGVDKLVPGSKVNVRPSEGPTTRKST